MAGIIILSTRSGAWVPPASSRSIKEIMFSRSPSRIAAATFSRVEGVSLPTLADDETLGWTEKCSIKLSVLLSLAVSVSLAFFTFINYTLDGLAMAIVRPQYCAIAKNAELSQGRPGIPKETLDSPRMVLLLNICVHQLSVFNVSCAAMGSEATAMTRQSTIKSSLVKPSFFAFWKILLITA